MNNIKQWNLAWIVSIILLSICIIQAYVIYDKVYRNQKDELIVEQNNFTPDTLSSSLLDKFKQDKKQEADLFNDFFNDDFFSSQHEPFAEMQRLQQQMLGAMGQRHQSMFKDSWDQWFDKRFSFDHSPLNKQGIQYHSEEKSDRYIISIQIPHLKNNQLKVEINEQNIALSGQFSQLEEQRNRHGEILSKREVHQTLSKVFPIPIDADHSSAQIDNQKDKIIINLPKKKTKES